MSKKKIEEAVTEAPKARAKRARTVTAEVPEPEQKAKGKPKAEVPKEPKEELVVFAFRLKTAERDAIHKAAGAAKASKFVRALTVAAAQGDEKTVVDLVRAAKAGMTS
jgi:hypothetical protein